MTNRAVFCLSAADAKKALGIEEEVLSAEWDMHKKTIKLYVEGDSLPPTAKGENIPVIDLTLTEFENSEKIWDRDMPAHLQRQAS